MYMPSGLAWPLAQGSLSVVFQRFIDYHFLAFLFRVSMSPGGSQFSLSIFKCDHSIQNFSLPLEGCSRDGHSSFSQLHFEVTSSTSHSAKVFFSDFRGGAEQCSYCYVVLIRNSDRAARPSHSSLERGGTAVGWAELAHQGPRSRCPCRVLYTGHSPYSLPKIKQATGKFTLPKGIVFQTEVHIAIILFKDSFLDFVPDLPNWNHSNRNLELYFDKASQGSYVH